MTSVLFSLITQKLQMSFSNYVNFDNDGVHYRFRPIFIIYLAYKRSRVLNIELQNSTVSERCIGAL